MNGFIAHSPNGIQKLNIFRPRGPAGAGRYACSKREAADIVSHTVGGWPMNNRRLLIHLVLVAVGMCSSCGQSAQTPKKQSRRGIQLGAKTEHKSKSIGDVYDGSHAILIGIDKYQKLPKLRGAVRDASAVRDALAGRGFRTTFIVDEEASSKRITRLLAEELPAQLKANDRVIIYFAGHGVSDGPSGKEEGILMPVEGDKEYPISTGIPMVNMIKWFNGYAAKHVLFVADACYTGLALTRNSGDGLRKTLSDYLEQITSRKVRYVLVAGGDDEEAHEYANQGVFTSYFLQGIDGHADTNSDGYITTAELYIYVSEGVSLFVNSELGGTQTPQGKRAGLGEFVFLNPIVQPAAISGSENGKLPQIAHEHSADGHQARTPARGSTGKPKPGGGNKSRKQDRVATATEEESGIGTAQSARTDGAGGTLRSRTGGGTGGGQKGLGELARSKGVATVANVVTVPSVIGWSPEAAQRKLAKQGLRAVSKTIKSNKTGTPLVVGTEAAQRTLARQELRAVSKTIKSNKTGTPPVVQTQKPSAGTKVPRGSAVRLTLARGIVVPLAGRSGASGNLTYARTLDVIKKNMYKMERCYHKTLRNNPKAADRISFKWKVMPTGEASDVSYKESSRVDPALGSCVARAIEGMKFPPPLPSAPTPFVEVVARSGRLGRPVAVTQVFDFRASTM